MKLIGSLGRQLCTNRRTDQDAAWNAESGGSREHELHGDSEAAKGRSTFGAVCLIEMHREGFWKLYKTVS